MQKAIIYAIKAAFEDDRRNILAGVLIAILLPPFLLILFTVAILSLPAEIFKEFIEWMLPEQILIYVYEIRPDLMEQTEVDTYYFGLPINREVQSYFGDAGSFDGRPIDYVTYKSNGDRIYAVGDGEVVEVDVGDAGMYVVIEHDIPDNDEVNNHLYSKYWYMDSVEIEQGDYVDKGQLIGYGLTDENELNYTQFFCFAIYGDNTDGNVDPIPYIGEAEFNEQGEIVFRDETMTGVIGPNEK